MDSVADLVSYSVVHEHSTPADFRLGQTIADEGGVTFIDLGPSRVTALVAGMTGPARNTLLEATSAGLHWHCSCTSNRARFCEHVIAAALEIRHKSPTHQ